MGKELEWRLIGISTDVAEACKLLSTLKRYIIRTTNKYICTLCQSNLNGHEMKYQLLICNSKPCKDEGLDIKCPWRGRIDICADTNRIKV
jgi:hypothetical protein